MNPLILQRLFTFTQHIQYSYLHENCASVFSLLFLLRSVLPHRAALLNILSVDCE